MKDRLVNLWDNMSARCNPLSALRKRCSTYDGVLNGFLSKEDFYDWVLSEYGHNLKHGSRYWDLDKDLCSNGNKIYNRETCVFVPHSVNTFFLSSKKTRGDLPQGVTFDTFTNKYASQIRYGCKQVKIGRFDNPISAHRAWQNKKLDIGRELVDSLPLGIKAKTFVEERLLLLSDDISKNILSEWG